jgi:hypothetical protein
VAVGIEIGVGDEVPVAGRVNSAVDVLVGGTGAGTVAPGWHADGMIKRTKIKIIAILAVFMAINLRPDQDQIPELSNSPQFLLNYIAGYSFISIHLS